MQDYYLAKRLFLHKIIIIKEKVQQELRFSMLCSVLQGDCHLSA